jgi:uncharacterized protein (UPF0332 family)
MNWDAFLETADRLAVGTTEGDWRSAVSRAYYAVFHFFSEWLQANGTSLGKRDQAHRNLPLGLFNCGAPQLQPLARRIEDLGKQRTGADYHLAVVVSQSEATDAVQEARGIVADFQAILTTTPAATIATGFHSYLQRIGRLPPP